MVELLKPVRGGFLRPFGCGWFIREFLLGNGPYGSPVIDPEVGAPQADVFFHYKMSLMRATALDRATRVEEKRARREKRPINPENIEELAYSETSSTHYTTTAERIIPSDMVLNYLENARTNGSVALSFARHPTVRQNV